MAPLLNSALDGGECSASRQGLLTPRERAPDTLWNGGWVDTRASLDTVKNGKISCLCRNRTPAIQPIDRLCTHLCSTKLEILKKNYRDHAKGLPRGRPISDQVGLVVDKVVVGQVFSEYLVSTNNSDFTNPSMFVNHRIVDDM
jgi:hypothetical protein